LKELAKMEATKFYSLPKLAYDYKDLEPRTSEQQLTTHHQKHHTFVFLSQFSKIILREYANSEGI
jgi:superoxide dismutase